MQFNDAYAAFPVNALFRKASLAEWERIGARSDPEAWEAAVGWFDQYRTLRAAREFSGDGLVLIGPPGTGKTYLACALLNELHNTGRATTAFLTDQIMSPLLRRRDYDEDVADAWTVLTRITAVVWDDILRFGINEQSAEGFLRARHARGVTTIITVNNDVNVSDALTSFLSTYSWAEFKGKDLRR